MLVTVDVTQADIDAGVKRKCDQCPIARAVRRVVGADKEVTVNPVSIYIDGGYWRTPLEASNFISDFDNGHPVVPFSFEVNVPCA